MSPRHREITDATPAAMFSHVSARGCQGPRFTQAACVRPSGQGASDVVIAEQIARNNGFFLQVEGALIDKRSHANDTAQTLRENKEFDDAVAAAVAFAQRDRQTLVIVTADHECAGFTIIGAGSFTNAEATTPPGNVDVFRLMRSALRNLRS